jgi:hypothetical protein
MEEDEGLKIFVVMVREISKELKIFTQSCKQIEMSIARGSVVMFSLTATQIALLIFCLCLFFPNFLIDVGSILFSNET